jgi:cytochrome c oxidase cbb3-type subunit 4
MLSGIVTAILLGTFLAGTAWAWSARRRADFELAARLPLDEPPGERERREPRSPAADAADAKGNAGDAP